MFQLIRKKKKIVNVKRFNQQFLSSFTLNEFSYFFFTFISISNYGEGGRFWIWLDMKHILVTCSNTWDLSLPWKSATPYIPCFIPSKLNSFEKQDPIDEQRKKNFFPFRKTQKQNFQSIPNFIYLFPLQVRIYVDPLMFVFLSTHTHTKKIVCIL